MVDSSLYYNWKYHHALSMLINAMHIVDDLDQEVAANHICASIEILRLAELQDSQMNFKNSDK